ncbi:MAG: hypothetical protein MUE85_10090 [Microscillaceae bacterium]|nr:hypothetical protein [Microscillaceae bacterium]
MSAANRSEKALRQHAVGCGWRWRSTADRAQRRGTRGSLECDRRASRAYRTPTKKHLCRAGLIALLPHKALNQRKKHQSSYLAL